MLWLSCFKCNKQLLFLEKNKYIQTNNYYLQIENKEIHLENSEEPDEITDKEYFVCEVCHAPKLLEAQKRIMRL